MPLDKKHKYDWIHLVNGNIIVDDSINLPYRLMPEALAKKTLKIEIVEKVDNERWVVLSTDFTL